MSSLAFLVFTASLAGLLLVCLQSWALVGWAVTIEVSWVGLTACYGYLAVSLGDGCLLFWAIGWLFLSAVELCLSLFGFLLLTELRGSALV